ncbi:MAG: EAL domain-containing protein [Nostoc indistinguendum CM1-VF10]|nr:EAL domain-containing protein [Nostoc indistinguendum CM1-VF10]
MFIIGLASYLSLLEYQDNAQWVIHTREVLEKTQELISQVSDAETGQRGYILTGKQRYLAPYNRANNEISHKVKVLRKLTADNPNQQRRIAIITPLIYKKLTLIKQTIKLINENNLEAALQIIKTDEGQQLMEKIRLIIKAIENEENVLLKQRLIEASNSARRTSFLIIFGSILASILVSLAKLIINQELAKRCRMEKKLQKAHDELENKVKERTAEIIQTNSKLKKEINQHNQTQAQLIHDAFHDSLTGLPNRALFVERVERALVLTKRHLDYKFAILFLDVDRFKVVNDSLGHLIGDQLLTALARRLEGCLRAGDTVARLGGDEFTILLDDIKDLNDVTNVANRINATLTGTFNFGRHEVFTTVSIGITFSTTNYKEPEELIRDADIAMYRAKKLGKARYEIFDSSMYAQAAQLLQLEMDLRRAVERQEFQVYYQPIVSLETYNITGFEALLRWQHPELGFISPEKFIPLAEETGMIVPIGYWVLREASRQMRAWQLRYPTNPPLTISVNICSKQFSHPNLIEEIRQILQDTGLEGSSLKLEITETVLMENSDSATAMILELQQMNIQLHLDDFGIGYSSLSYLHRFSCSALKIDRSFVTKIGANGENLEIVQAIISLAHSLNIDVIAEGLETMEQLRQLQIKKCQHAQGYIFSRPLDSNSVDTLIASSLHFQLDSNLLGLSHFPLSCA